MLSINPIDDSKNFTQAWPLILYCCGEFDSNMSYILYVVPTLAATSLTKG